MMITATAATFVILILSFRHCHAVSPDSDDNVTECPGDGWVHFGRHCYKFVSDTRTSGSRSASDMCEDVGKGSRLAAVQSVAEESFLRSYIKNLHPANTTLSTTTQTNHGAEADRNWNQTCLSWVARRQDAGFCWELPWQVTIQESVCGCSEPTCPFICEWQAGRSSTVTVRPKTAQKIEDVETLLSDPHFWQDSSAVSTVMASLSNMIDSNFEELTKNNTARRILDVMQLVVENIPLTDGNATFSLPNIFLAVNALHRETYAGLSLATRESAAGSLQAEVSGPTTAAADGSRLDLPDDLLTSAANCSADRIAMSILTSSAIFEALHKQTAEGNDTKSGKDKRVGSLVMSAGLVGCSIQNLVSPVRLSFTHTLYNITHSRPSCVFWDETLRDWSSKGCYLKHDVGSSVFRTLCQCYHLSSFALLLDVYGEVGLKDEQALTIHRYAISIISYIGCSVSFIALVLNIAVYAVANPMAQSTSSQATKTNMWFRSERVSSRSFRLSRQTHPSRILLNLCAALALTNLIFLVGMQPYSFQNHAACKVVAILLHFFLLSSLCWMAVEAIHMYLAFVKVFRTNIKHFKYKSAAVGWGVPLVIVSITTGVNTGHNYGLVKNQICWLKGTAFYAAFMAPVCLILLLNLVAFVPILRTVLGLSGRKLRKSNALPVARRLRGAIGVVILLGLTWVFAFLAVGSASVAFSYLFAICNSSQGLFIFLFYGLLKMTSRRVGSRQIPESQVTSRAPFSRS